MNNKIQKQPPQVFYKNWRSEKCRKFHRKAPALESFFNKIAGLQACLLKKETPTQVFSCEIWDIFKNAYFKKHL